MNSFRDILQLLKGSLTSSTDQNPNHSMCPKGDDSWCSYQRVKVNWELASYNQDFPSLCPDFLSDIKLIYEYLSSDNLLLRCVDGFNQNNNETFNQLVWKISPKPLNLLSYKLLHTLLLVYLMKVHMHY